ncbi:MAG: carbohydrate ABC transporter permease [Spirochaetia bacterium]|nr:carbohydrate ABC transporter permease [Spirochaetia bacterium]
MISIALSSDRTVATNAFTVFPREFGFDNFGRIFATSMIYTYILNSIKLSFFAIVGQLLVSSFVAYGFARLRARGKNIVFMILLATMMIPSEVTMIPQFLIFRSLRMLDTLYPLILPNFFGGAFNIFLLRQSIMRIPYAFDEAAIVEGVGYPRIWFSLILPAIQPILVAISIFTFSWNWGWFTGPLIYISSPEKYPLALGAYFITETSAKGAIPPWNLIMVTALLLTLPMIMVYALGQKYVYAANIGGGGLK